MSDGPSFACCFPVMTDPVSEVAVWDLIFTGNTDAANTLEISASVKSK